MANVRERIKKEIAVQKSIEGEKCQDKLLLDFLEVITTQLQWNVFVNVEFYRYGKYSHQNHRFYYPKEELVKLMQIGVNAKAYERRYDEKTKSEYFH